MKLNVVPAVVGSAALVLLSADRTYAHGSQHGAHERAHLEQRLNHSHGHQIFQSPELLERTSPIVKRNSQGKALCELPDHPDLVKVPGKMNSGFAMAPDVECTEGKYCPIACKSGMLMAQWEPGSKVAYPESMVDYFPSAHKVSAS